MRRNAGSCHAARVIFIISRAVEMCPQAGRPLGFLNRVCVAPKDAARSVI